MCKRDVSPIQSVSRAGMKAMRKDIAAGTEEEICLHSMVTKTTRVHTINTTLFLFQKKKN